MYKRITNIAEKIKDARLKIDEWKVLFAVDNNSNPQKIADFLEISLEKVNDALAHLVEDGFITSGDEVETVEKTPAVEEVAPMKMEPEKQAEELVEELFETSDDETVLEEEVIEDEEPPVVETVDEDIGEESFLEEIEEETDEEELVIEEEVIEESVIEKEADDSDEVSFDLDDENEEELAFDDLLTDDTSDKQDKPIEEIAEEPKSEKPAPADDTKKPSGDSKKIMIVDDSIVIRKMVEIALENENYTIESAVSGKEALKKIDAIEPDLVILDIMLPDVSGIEILKAIKASKGIPVIMLSGKNSPQDIELAKAQGADDFAPKPFKEEELVEKIKALL